MYFIVLGVTLLAWPQAIPPAQDAAAAQRIVLRDAVRLALEHHPEVRTADADRRAAEAALLEAKTYPFNPELSVETGPSRSPERSGADASVSLRQTVELGAKRSKRVAVATARLGAETARYSWSRLGVAVRVRKAYGLAILARHRVVSSREAEAISSELKAAAEERLRLGAGTLLELNVATAAAGRARAERLSSELGLQEAQIALGAAVGDPRRPELEPVEDQLPRFAAILEDENAFVERALAARPDLDAAKREAEAASAGLRFADSVAVPDLTLGLTQGHESQDESRSTIFGVSIPLPLFNRNQGPRAAARAALYRSSAQEDAVRQAVARDARAAYRRYTLTRQAVEGFDQDVVGKLGENLALALQSFQAGKIGLLEFNIVRRELVETRLAFLGAERELVEAQAALELAAGAPLETP
ncbi:MAG: TolC family protein [Acidobacteria bacterium]|nr:TolC family protein [Acidobacteriota bacterium]